MSNKIKVVGLALVAVMAFSAIAASAASAAEAPRWKVNGAFLGNGVAKTFTASLKAGTKAELAVPKLGLTLESSNCSATGEIVGSAAGVESTGRKGVLNCKEISVKNAPACEVEDVTTANLSGNLGWMESTLGSQSSSALFHPESGTNFTTINITECAFEGEFPITGETAGGLFPVAEEVVTGELVFGPVTTVEHWFTPKEKDPENKVRPTMPVAGLLFGANPATFNATFSVGLTSSEKAGVFLG